jgi:hypothetical protein
VQGLRLLSIDTIRVGRLLPLHARFSALSPARSTPRFDKPEAKLELKKIYSCPKAGFPAFYPSLDAYKDIILNENAGKAAIYMITNKVTKLKFIGKSSNLQARLVNFFSATPEFLENNKGSSLIYRNLLRFGFNNFSLTILEYCSLDDLQARKQFYIDIFKPRLNIRKVVTITGVAHNTKISKKNYIAEPTPNLKSKDDIINDLHKLNPDLAEFKKNIACPGGTQQAPIEVKDMMDLAESNNNPLE